MKPSLKPTKTPNPGPVVVVVQRGKPTQVRRLRRNGKRLRAPWWTALKQRVHFGALTGEPLSRMPCTVRDDRIACFVSYELDEHCPRALAEIAWRVRAIGQLAACNVLIRVLQVELAGGLERRDGAGKHSKAGVFFRLTSGIYRREACA